MSGTCTVSVYFSNNKIFAALRYLLFCLTRVLVLYFRRILVRPAFKMFNNSSCAKATHIYISFCKELFCPLIILLAISLTLKKGCARQWFWKGLLGIFLVCILRLKSCCYFSKKVQSLIRIIPHIFVGIPENLYHALFDTRKHRAFCLWGCLFITNVCV